MPYRKLRPEALEKARALMADRTLTIADVVCRSGVSPQTLYKYFPELKGRPHRGGNAPLPPETLAQAHTLMVDYALTVPEVARRAGVSPQTLYDHFPALRRCPRLTPDELAAMRTLMADHTLTVAEAARRAGVAPQTLYHYFPDLKGRPHRGGSPGLPVETRERARTLMADHSLTVRDVARRAGVSIQALYKYFPDLKGRPNRGRGSKVARTSARPRKTR